jgi:hypothetical protein
MVERLRNKPIPKSIKNIRINVYDFRTRDVWYGFIGAEKLQRLDSTQWL